MDTQNENKELDNKNSFLIATANTNKRQKKIGTREEVYNGVALQTSGGMTRDDIMQEMRGGNIYYKSKVISQRMKENSPLLKTKKLTRKKVAFNEENNTIRKYEI